MIKYIILTNIPAIKLSILFFPKKTHFTWLNIASPVVCVCVHARAREPVSYTHLHIQSSSKNWRLPWIKIKVKATIFLSAFCLEKHYAKAVVYCDILKKLYWVIESRLLHDNVLLYKSQSTVLDLKVEHFVCAQTLYKATITCLWSWSNPRSPNALSFTATVLKSKWSMFWCFKSYKSVTKMLHFLDFVSLVSKYPMY